VRDPVAGLIAGIPIRWVAADVARALSAGLVLALLASGCDTTEPEGSKSRQDAIPEDAVKVTPETDEFLPVLHVAGWADPVPLAGPVNTAGGEDSPFVSPDGQTFLFFFTPDVEVPAGEQVSDGVSGIWVSTLAGGSWSEPTRVVLSSVPSLEGAPTLAGDDLWFASARGGNYGEIDVWIAERTGSAEWGNWHNAGSRLNQDLDIGEWHLASGGDTLYFGWADAAGYGDLDIWAVARNGGDWGTPWNLGPAVNSAGHESRPFLTTDGSELWFTGTSHLGYHGPAVFRSLRTGEGWGEPQEIISNYAAEPCLDDQGNIYFIHHFMTAEEEMIEADVYFCRKL
jgi:hypothetical protein